MPPVPKPSAKVASDGCEPDKAPRPRAAKMGFERERRIAVSLDDAEAMALTALAFLAEDEDRLGRCMGETGLSFGDLATIAGRSELLAAILDYLLADESMLLVFTSNAGIAPALVAPAAAVLADAGAVRRR